MVRRGRRLESVRGLAETATNRRFRALRAARKTVSDVHDSGRLDDGGLLEVERRAGVVEQPHAAAEQHRHDMEQQLAYQPRRKALPRDARAAGNGNVSSPRSLTRLPECHLNSVRDEREGRATAALERRPAAAGLPTIKRPRGADPVAVNFARSCCATTSSVMAGSSRITFTASARLVAISRTIRCSYRASTVTSEGGGLDLSQRSIARPSSYSVSRSFTTIAGGDRSIGDG